MFECLCLFLVLYIEILYSVCVDGMFELSKVCMFMKNYCSYACIIEISLKLFYFDRLECCVDFMWMNIFKGWEEFLNLLFLVVFDGVMGEEF